MTKTFYTRCAPLILVAAALLVPAMIVGVRGSLRESSNDVRQWLPQGFAEARQYDWFLSHFGSEEIVVVSWPGCTVDDPRVPHLAEALRKAELDTTTAGPGDRRPVFRSVMTGPELLDGLMAGSLKLSREDALRRLEGSLVGPDLKTTALVAQISATGAADRSAALATIEELAQAHAGVSPQELRLGGPTVDSVALDVESERSRNLLTAISVVLALLLAWRCLRHVRLVVIVFAVALLCAGGSLALVHFTGGTMNLVLIMMPTLIYVLSISGAVHLANYYREAVAEGADPTEAPSRAVAAAGWPCTIAAVTTAIGLGSLGVSEVIPVKMFGVYSSVSVLGSLVVLFLVLPAALQLWPLRREESLNAELSTEPLSLDPDESHWSHRAAMLVGRHRRLIVGVAVGSMAFLSVGLWKLDTTVKVMSFFSPEAKIIRDYAWLEENLGPLVPIEIVLRFDKESPLTMHERLELSRRVQERLEAMDKVGGSLSAATFAPGAVEGGGIGSLLHRRVQEEKLQRARERFVEARYLRTEENGDELWRVSARVEALNSLDYGRFIPQLRAEIDPIVEAAGVANGEYVETIYTGVMPLLYKAQRELLSDLTSSFISAFVLIGLSMVMLLRSLPAGLLSMLPNVFPAVAIFGGMGWLGMLVGVGSMMTASLALGIAVDNAIHFLSWFRRGMQEGLTRPQAIQIAYQRCAGAMMQTTLICGLGLLVFAFSSFVPASRFAWLMFTLLTSALLGDLILLPALLAGSAGKYFEGGRGPTPSQEPLWHTLRRLWQRATFRPVPVEQ